MNYKDKYYEWIESEYFDEQTRKELLSIKNQEKEIEDRFYKDLEFGTGGLRGKIGAGTNRINKYTVAKATQGLANYIIKCSKNAIKDCVVIAYDSRHKSKEFSKTVARVLSANGIKAFLFEDLRPTPLLSYAVRELGCIAGIVITASHNPPEYNGYKVYWKDGGQVIPTLATQIIEEINKIDDFKKVKMIDIEKAMKNNLFEIVGKEIDDKYIEQVKALSVRDEVDKNIKIIYTPLHGAGNIPVRRVLNELGYKYVHIVPEQELPDPNFSTVKSPNPEEKSAFDIAIKMSRNIDADLIVGTDPDCDRVGAVVRNIQGDYIIINGNQTGALLLDYYLGAKEDTLTNKDFLIKTIVTSELGKVIADYYGVQTIDTLTGFKFIGEKIKDFEESQDKNFVFGYEESYGYLAGTFVRDKDAVIASMLICEMAAYYKTQGKSLYEALIDLYDKYGYFIEDLKSIKLEGKEGSKKINKVMDYFRNNYIKEIDRVPLKYINDYSKKISKHIITNEENKITLPTSNVLKFIFEDNSWFTLRPSGTEPKLKIYFSVFGNTMDDIEKKLKLYETIIMKKIKSLV